MNKDGTASGPKVSDCNQAEGGCRALHRCLRRHQPRGGATIVGNYYRDCGVERPRTKEGCEHKREAIRKLLPGLPPRSPIPRNAEEMAENSPFSLGLPALVCRQNSIAFTKQSGIGEPGDTSPGNRLKHCYFACCLTKAVGQERALKLLDANENDTIQWYEHPSRADRREAALRETSQDDITNRFGVAFGHEASSGDCAQTEHVFFLHESGIAGKVDCCADMCMCALLDGDLPGQQPSVATHD